ncbi:MAG TPA: hypothetical protein VF221_17615 [Chloroflexota bacterium]
MGRQSRQTRRAQDRRAQHARRHQPQRSGPNWSIIAGVCVLLAVAVVFGILYATQGNGLASPSATPTEVPAAAVDGIGCNPGGEVVTYHEHAHLALFDHGKAVTVPALIGFNVDHDCLFWMHTHDPSYGLIHEEAPHKIVPKLGTFFKIWQEPLSSHQVGTIEVKPGDKIRTYVDGKEYFGDPSSIKLPPHTNVVIEVGPPFVAPPPFTYPANT